MPRTARLTTRRAPVARHSSVVNVIAAMAAFAPAETVAEPVAPAPTQPAVAASVPATPAEAPERTERTEITACRARITHLRAQAQDIDDDVASLTHTACEMGEASDWCDARLPALNEEISFWQGRYRALLAQITGERARLITLLSEVAQDTAQVMQDARQTTTIPFGWDTRPRGATPIAREAW